MMLDLDKVALFKKISIISAFVLILNKVQQDSLGRPNIAIIEGLNGCETLDFNTTVFKEEVFEVAEALE